MLIKDAELLNFVGSKKQMEYLHDIFKTTHKETYADHEHIGIGDRNLSDGYKIVIIICKKLINKIHLIMNMLV